MPGRVSMKSLQSRDRIQRGSYTSGSSSTHSRLKRPPVSVDAEHRVVIHTVKQCVKDIQGYHELRRDVDVEDCAQTAHDIMEYSHEKASGDDVVDFLKVVQAKEYVFEGAIKERKAYETLVNFAENVEKYAVSFPIIIEVMKNCITDHLNKYCVSFRDEATADDVISTREYEEKIRDYKRTLEEKLKDLEDNSDRFEKLSKPFVEKCVLGMTEVSALIVESCKGVNAMRDIIRQWIARDKAYPKKLGDEIYHGNEHRNKLRAQLTVITKKTEALYPTKRKHDRIRAHLVDKLTDQRREKRRILNSKATLDELVEKSERELEQVRSDAERTHQRIAQRKSNSPKYLDSLWANQDRLKTEDTKIEHRLESFKRQLSRMDKDIVLLDDVISKLEGELAEVGYTFKEVNDKIEQLIKEFDQVENQMKDQEAQTQKAKRIRNMKLDPISIRKIFYQRLDPAEPGMDICARSNWCAFAPALEWFEGFNNDREVLRNQRGRHGTRDLRLYRSRNFKYVVQFLHKQHCLVVNVGCLSYW
ncbi:hypothetical protein CAPTEDRAFT_192729 [Capitella teleta]|uniref:Uncharacterized protein n=1 Tax=Capitella teleta TaxID=283909 RepID=R7UU36_CAPTE|nr:hypothetical protein CAPTEDRAFT_192729 [Capitella teleta]|eukprot:ELU09658.1 hypothetical protein CAPTEDRAFT_192729 [Capitella teleta]